MWERASARDHRGWKASPTRLVRRLVSRKIGVAKLVSRHGNAEQALPLQTVDYQQNEKESIVQGFKFKVLSLSEATYLRVSAVSFDFGHWTNKNDSTTQLFNFFTLRVSAALLGVWSWVLGFRAMI